jgi:hypothetical protein
VDHTLRAFFFGCPSEYSFTGNLIPIDRTMELPETRPPGWQCVISFHCSYIEEWLPCSSETVEVWNPTILKRLLHQEIVIRREYFYRLIAPYPIYPRSYSMVWRFGIGKRFIGKIMDSLTNGLIECIEISGTQTTDCVITSHSTKCTDVAQHVLDIGINPLILLEMTLNDLQKWSAVLASRQPVTNSYGNTSYVWDQWRVSFCGESDCHGTPRTKKNPQRLFVARQALL